MAWTTPGTATAGEVLTASFWNSNVRDNANELWNVMKNVKSTTLTTATTVSVTTGGTFYDISGLSVSFTPTASTYKALIIANVDVTCATTDDLIGLRLVRNSTAIGIATSAGSRIPTTAGAYLTSTVMTATAVHFQVPMQFLDTHGLGTTITYKVQATTNGSGRTVYVNRSQADVDGANTFRATSSITVIEVPV